MAFKMTFRWYGENDKVTLDDIRQIPCVQGVVSAIYDTPVGEVWSEESIARLKKLANDKGLTFEVVESVPYDHETVLAMNPLTSELSLPGWDASYTREGLKELLEQYKEIDDEKLWQNMTVFLKEVIPVAEESGVKMAIHPDDPPWGIFGLPRVIIDEKNLKRFLSIVDSPSNGITLCTGSLGVNPMNNLVSMIKTCKGRMPFVHLRNIKITGDHCFEESGHLSEKGSLDMYEIIKALYDGGFDGYVRPDHGRMIWGETGRAGYGLYDRALGAMYLQGIIEAVEKGAKK